MSIRFLPIEIPQEYFFAARRKQASEIRGQRGFTRAALWVGNQNSFHGDVNTEPKLDIRHAIRLGHWKHPLWGCMSGERPT